MTGILLAGGGSTRMGTNKAFLRFGDERLIDRILRRYRRVFREVIVVTNDPLLYIDADAAIVTDILPGRGALGGIYTGLHFAGNPKAFVAACDMPFLDPAFLSYLMAEAERFDIVVPCDRGGLQPLHAVYDRRCLPAIRRQLEGNDLKITRFYRGFRVRTIGEEETRPFDPEGKMFLNVNAPQDLLRLRNR